MRNILLISAAFLGGALGASAQQLNVLSYGGAFEASQVKAYNEPFAQKTGIRVNMMAADDPGAVIKAQAEAGNVSVDVVDLATSDVVRLCDEGILMEIDPAILPAGDDGTPAEEDFFDGALVECGVANILWGNVIGYDARQFGDNPPTKAADFFDLETYPGKRSLPRLARRTLYLALIADGASPDEIYDLLATPEGVDRAFAKLDTIKRDVVWWEAGAQPVQLLADGEVAMATAYNGRLFDAMVSDGQAIEIIWDAQYMEMDLFAIPKDAPNPEAAMEYLLFATDTQRLADQARYIAYGPARKSSAALVGLFQDGETEMAPHMPTNPDNMNNAVMDDPEFWADNENQLNERFNSWLASN